MQYVGAISLFLVIPLGFALLWAARVAYCGRGTSDQAALWFLTIAGWACIVLGLVGTVVGQFLFLSPLGLVVVLVILLMALGRYRMLERRSLLWCLSVAAAKGIPLEQAARAFADERPSGVGTRAARLADLLESGMPLPEALATARIWLATDALIAVRVGCDTGKLTSAMATVARTDDELDFLLRSLFEKFVYLVLIVNVLVFTLVFLMIKIVPVFAKMFDEFALELPQITQALIAVSEFFVNLGWLLFVPVLFFVLVAALFGVLYYVGWYPRDFAPLNRLTLRYDGSVVMRLLALAVRESLPLDTMIGLLSRSYPRSNVRARLSAAGERILAGEPWCDSLHDTGLIGTTETAVLKSATRVGNLAWALDEMAASSLRRVSYQLRLWLNILFPLTLLVFGLIVAFHVIGLFAPLVHLIGGLT
jgi:type II secretory pathway component PulF